MTKISLDEHAERCIWHDGKDKVVHGDEPQGLVFALERKYLPTGQTWVIVVKAVTRKALDLAMNNWNNQSPALWEYRLLQMER